MSLIFTSNTATEIDTTTMIFRVKLYHTWLPDEFADLIENISFLYNYILIFSNMDIIYKNDFPYLVLPSQMINDSDKAKTDIIDLFSYNFLNNRNEINWKVLPEIGKRFSFPFQLDLRKIDYINSSIDLLGISSTLGIIKDLYIDLKKLSFEKEKYKDGDWLRNVQLHKEIFELENLISSADYEKRKRELESNILLQEFHITQIEKLEKIKSLTDNLKLSEKQKKDIYKKIEISMSKLLDYSELEKIENILLLPDK